MFEDKMEKLDIWDIGLIKIAVASFTLALISYIPGLMNWVHNTNKHIFLLVALVFAIRPQYKVWIKK